MTVEWLASVQWAPTPTVTSTLATTESPIPWLHASQVTAWAGEAKWQIGGRWFMRSVFALASSFFSSFSSRTAQRRPDLTHCSLAVAQSGAGGTASWNARGTDAAFATAPCHGSVAWGERSRSEASQEMRRDQTTSEAEVANQSKGKRRMR